MKKLQIHFIEHQHHLQDLVQSMDEMQRTPIDQLNWHNFSYQPKVEFTMLWSEHSFFIKYWVNEKYTMALAEKDNGPVWKDSCVEFFVSPDANDFYYNFEFNCIGTCLLAYGNSRHERLPATGEVFNKIKRFPSLKPAPFNEITGQNQWDLMVEIPFSCFFRHDSYKDVPGTIKANFYKCGDGLSQPHYLTWNPVETEQPDYHRPEFFGELELIR